MAIFKCCYSSTEQTNNHNKEQADKRISKKMQKKKKTRKKTAQEQNTNGKHAECGHIKKSSEPKKRQSRILKHMKINI
jgi:hypothetical protein